MPKEVLLDWCTLFKQWLITLHFHELRFKWLITHLAHRMQIGKVMFGITARDKILNNYVCKNWKCSHFFNKLMVNFIQIYINENVQSHWLQVLQGGKVNSCLSLQYIKRHVDKSWPSVLGDGQLVTDSNAPYSERLYHHPSPPHTHNKGHPAPHASNMVRSSLKLWEITAVEISI